MCHGEVHVYKVAVFPQPRQYIREELYDNISNPNRGGRWVWRRQHGIKVRDGAHSNALPMPVMLPVLPVVVLQFGLELVLRAC